MTAPAGVVIVGGGVAGATAAQTLRSGGYPGPVTIIGAEPGLPYRRTALSKDLLSADLRPERIGLRKLEVWAEDDVQIRSGTTVLEIDSAAATVRLDDGSVLGFQALILATGAAPVRPGWLDQDVPCLRTLADAERIRDAISADPGPLVIVGGGLIGLELAASVVADDREVIVLEAAERLLSRVAPEAVSGFIADLHRARGVQCRLGSPVQSADARQVRTRDGQTLRGTVVAALGAVPDTVLARAAGLAVTEAGIVVDGALRTGTAGIYAAGDCAAVPDPRTGEPARGEHWFGAQDQGAAAARSVLADLAGRPAPVYAEVPRAWTMQYGTNLQFVGWPTAPGAVTVDGDLTVGDLTVGQKPEATITVAGPGGLVGAVTVGRAAAARDLRTRMAESLGTVV
ncbi:rubredoxin reductase [Gordonia hirsuta DSM 44140 = NBRC 16056]|uniref:Rubredoxin reductase n=1 Tax=Gordonia hirsuta DSM 44140 = NBRC 16056 TaxID=1121927 RepID=L7L9H2_9ACTN|nr:FAD-dependent oxidoreductase [Gordonia hirsuta]GAC57795.1 rubredoxin reductase [Gordonia hirsuta DSM 44140 = NBRC 16056]